MIKVWGGNHSERAFKTKLVEPSKAGWNKPELYGQHSRIHDECSTVSGVRRVGHRERGHGAFMRGKAKR